MNGDKWSIHFIDMLYAMYVGIGLGIIYATLIGTIHTVFTYYKIISSFFVEYAFFVFIGLIIMVILCCWTLVSYYQKRGYRLGLVVLCSSFTGLYFSILQLISMVTIKWGYYPTINIGDFLTLQFIVSFLTIPLVIVITYLMTRYFAGRGIGFNGRKLSIFGLELSDEKWPVHVSDISLAITAGIGLSFLSGVLLLLAEVIYNYFYWSIVDGITYVMHEIISTDTFAAFYCLCIVIMGSLALTYVYQNKGYKTTAIVLLCGFAGLLASLFQPDPFATFQLLFGERTGIRFFDRLLSSLIISLPVAILCSYLFIKLITKKNPGPERKKLLKASAFAIIVIMAIPVFALILGNTMGVIVKLPVYADEPLQEVRRTANDTIIVTNVRVSEPLGKYLDRFNDQKFTILINGSLASNITEIEQNGLKININPETGLDFKLGQSVTFSGPDVSDVNNTSVIIVFKNGYENKFFGRYSLSGGGRV